MKTLTTIVVALALVILSVVGVKAHKKDEVKQKALKLEVSGLLEKYSACENKPVERKEWIKNLNQDLETCNGVGIPHYMLELPTSQITVFDLKDHKEYIAVFDRKGDVENVSEVLKDSSLSSIK